MTSSWSRTPGPYGTRSRLEARGRCTLQIQKRGLERAVGLEPMTLCLGNIPPSALWPKYLKVERNVFSYRAFGASGNGRSLSASLTATRRQPGCSPTAPTSTPSSGCCATLTSALHSDICTWCPSNFKRKCGSSRRSPASARSGAGWWPVGEA